MKEDRIKMAENKKEKSAEEIKNEKAEAEKKENVRQIALKNLGSALWNYASPKLITSEAYGSLAQGAQAFYGDVVSKTPDQHVYEQLFLSQLSKEGGAITSPYLQATSLKILQESMFSVKVSDIMKYAGAKSVGENFKDKYVFELGEKEAGMIVGSCMQYQADEKVKEIIGLRQKEVSSGLEKILADPEKPKE